MEAKQYLWASLERRVRHLARKGLPHCPESHIDEVCDQTQMAFDDYLIHGDEEVRNPDALACHILKKKIIDHLRSPRHRVDSFDSLTPSDPRISLIDPSFEQVEWDIATQQVLEHLRQEDPEVWHVLQLWLKDKGYEEIGKLIDTSTTTAWRRAQRGIQFMGDELYSCNGKE